MMLEDFGLEPERFRLEWIASAEAQKFADVKLQESLFRREAMVVVLGIILVNVLALYIIRRRIHAESEAS